jgi:uncharacterized membrane protein
MASFRLYVATAMLGLACWTPLPAQAALLFCNHTQSPVEAAVGYREQEDWISEGWWQIQPGQCARVYGKPLVQRFYFYYAHVLAPPSKDGKAPLTWAGKYAFCVDTKAFRAEGDTDCESRGYQEKGFSEIDIGANKHDYTLTFLDGSGE